LHKGIHAERGTSIKDVCINILYMVVICKNWQALPVSATTVNVPNIEDCTQPPSPGGLPDDIQQPTAHLSSKPDIVELHKINHDEPNEPRAINNCNTPTVVKPKKRLQIIQQQGLLDQFSFSSSSVMIGGAVLTGLVLIMSANKGPINTKIGQALLSGF